MSGLRRSFVRWQAAAAARALAQDNRTVSFAPPQKLHARARQVGRHGGYMVDNTVMRAQWGAHRSKGAFANSKLTGRGRGKLWFFFEGFAEVECSEALVSACEAERVWRVSFYLLFMSVCCFVDDGDGGRRGSPFNARGGATATAKKKASSCREQLPPDAAPPPPPSVYPAHVRACPSVPPHTHTDSSMWVQESVQRVMGTQGAQSRGRHDCLD